jgi:hypothetical protein
MSANTGAGRNDAEVGVADRCRGRGAEAAGSFDDDECGAILFERAQARFDVERIIGLFDNGFCLAAALPV